MKKGSILYGTIKMKCPRCQEGDLFVTKNHYDLGSFLKMHKNCSECNQTYNPEPGFYFGAAYMSYGIAVAIAVAVSIAMLVLGVRNHVDIIIGIVVATVILAPPNFRYSRALWANINIRFKGKEQKN